MKKYIVAIIPFLLLGSCKKDLTSLNNDPKNPLAVSSASLFTNAQRVLSNTVTSSNVNLNIFRLITQQWQETTYVDESNYDLTTRQIPQGVWNTLYRDVLRDLQEAKRLTATDVTDAASAETQTAIIDIMEVYAWYYLVTTFGNIPYTEALDIDNAFPVYDDAMAIYADLLRRLDADIAILKVAQSPALGDADVIYSGDPAAWARFAASFKLKMGLTIADADASMARTAVESAVTDGIFRSNSDNALFEYLSGPPNTNPVWVDLVQSGRQDYVANRTIITNMVSNNDPRLPFYFTFNAAGSYSGGAPGASSNFATFSKPSGPNLVLSSTGRVTNADFPGDLLDYAEIQFLLAEAKERGFNAGAGTAGSYYDAAVKASLEYWGVGETDVNLYRANNNVKYDVAAGNYKQKIGTQKWLALYNRGWDAWIEIRRLDYPVLPAPASPRSDFPVRYTYPTTEQNVNGVNYAEASSAIGGDVVTTKLFFDKN